MTEKTPNKAALKVLNKLFDSGYNSESAILNMSLENMLAIPAITVPEISIINEMQKSIKEKRVLAFLGGAENS